MTEFKGSCICGLIQYQISGDVKKFFLCHCSRCRKSHGTNHASNIIIKPEIFKWNSGEKHLSTYKIPDAEHFYTLFCSKCGSPLPRIFHNGKIIVIPAGSIDSKFDITPTDHIMCDSRLEWGCFSEDIPNWPKYPE